MTEKRWKVAKKGPFWTQQENSQHAFSHQLFGIMNYFWKKKTPEHTEARLIPVTQRYLPACDKLRVDLVDPGFGAIVAPFVRNWLPYNLRQIGQPLVLLAPDPNGAFEMHVVCFVRNTSCSK